MNVKCLFGIHSWDGCVCSECGKKYKDSGYCPTCGKKTITWEGLLYCVNCHVYTSLHDWSKDCEQCLKCGLTRKDKHDYSKTCNLCVRCGKERDNHHIWNGCKCSHCGSKRDEEHDWKLDCEECSICHKKRNNTHSLINCKCVICGKIRHYWDGCVCIKCNKYSIKIATDLFSSSVKKGDVITANKIIIQGVEINSLNNNGDLPLFFTFFEILIKTGVELDKQNKIKEEPKHAIARNNLVIIVKALIDHGMDKDIKSGDICSPNTPLDLACLNNLPDIAELLIKAGATSEHHLFEDAIIRGDILILEVLNKYKKNVKYGADFYKSKKTGDPLLSLAAKENKKEIAEWIRRNINQSEMDQIIMDLNDKNKEISYNAAQALLFIGDLQATEPILNHSLSLDKRIDVMFYSDSEELSRNVNFFIDNFNKCRFPYCDFSNVEGDDWSIQEWKYNSESTKEAFHKLTKFKNPISNNILHLLTRIKDKNVITKRVSFSSDSYITLDFSEIRKGAKEVLQERGTPDYNASAFVNKEAWK